MSVLNGKSKYLGFVGRIFFLISLVVICMNLPAKADIHFKGMAGVTLSGTNIWHLSSTNNFGYGLGVELWIFEYVGIEIDSLVVKKGHGVNSPGTYTDSDGTFTEISLPLLLKFRLPLGSTKIGAYGGIAISPITNDMDTNFSKHDKNIILGGFIEKWFTKAALFLDIRYDMGLNTLSIEYIPSRISFKTRTLYMMGGIKIRL